MTKINFGAGGDIKFGWRNVDIMFAPPDNVDISKPLPIDSDSVDFIYSSHTVEHLDSPSALRFFDECHRILKDGGVARIAVPSVSKIVAEADQEYCDWLNRQGFGYSTKRGAARNIVLGHGHLSCWNEAILESLLFAAGFDRVTHCNYNFSTIDHLRNLEAHGKVIGEHNSKIETIVAEATK